MWTRRSVLRLAAAAVPGLMLGCAGGFEPDLVPESVERFPRTPIAGDMTSTRVVITCFVADDVPVTLRVWTDEEVVVDQELPSSGTGFHKVRVDDLTPGTTYQYAVFAGDPKAFENRSLIGQVRTAPAEGESPVLRIGLMSCIGQGTILPD